MAVTAAANVSDRVCVVGAGPAGLAAARAVQRAGYERITVFEAAESAGGKCDSIEHDGVVFDMGAFALSSEYLRARALAKTLDVALKPAGRRFLDLETKTLRTLGAPGATTQWMFRLLKTLEAKTHDLVCNADFIQRWQLHLPIGEWLERFDLSPAPDAMRALYEGTGYGFFDEDVPVLYFLRTMRIAFGEGLVAVEGMQTLVKRFAEMVQSSGVSIEYGTPVHAIETGPSISVHVAAGESRFDRVIWAAGVAGFTAACPWHALSQGALRDVEYMDYRSIAVEAPGLPHVGRELVHVEGHTVGRTRDHASFYAPVDDERPLFLVWQYGSGRSTADLDQTLVDDLRSYGATDVELLQIRRWSNYFAFVRSGVAQTFWRTVERDQGDRQVYLTGSPLSMELIEPAMEHAELLVASNF